MPLLPATVGRMVAQGLRTDRHAEALAASAARALLSEDPPAWEGAAPADAAGAGALLAACLAGGAPRPAARLALARRLLHAARGWAAAGSYAAAGGGDPCRACAALQAADAAAARVAGPGALIEAAASPLPVQAEAALALLSKRQPPSAWASAMRDAFVAAPELVEAYGAQQLPALLDAPPSDGAAPQEGDGARKQPWVPLP
jgi:hypothetical protein